jgi:hypothetical protein
VLIDRSVSLLDTLSCVWPRYCAFSYPDDIIGIASSDTDLSDYRLCVSVISFCIRFT